jgi:carbon starvation protein
VSSDLYLGERNAKTRCPFWKPYIKGDGYALNSVVALLLGLLVVILGYKLYAGFVDTRIIQPNPKKATPAKMYVDGVDFIPTARNILFGYQFKSIAGAAPVVGAIVALQWGWLPAMLWLFFGVLFIGWVHDYASAMVSLRSDGLTLGGLSHKLISPRARLILLSFIYFYLLLVAGAFGAIIASLFAAPLPTPVGPKAGSAFLGILILTLAGLLAGQMIYRWKRDIIVTSQITVALAVGGIILGAYLPAQTLLGGVLSKSTIFWALLTFLFCYLGATLPIWRFAQPINYVSFYIVFLGLLGGVIGAFVGHPDFTLPAFTQVTVPKLGPIWPILFVTLACGAISGWHSLVSTSGTARQLESESDARPVAAGSMFAEMMLGLLALVAACVAYPGLDGYKAALAGGPATVFSEGMATLLGFIGIPAGLGGTFAAVLIIVLAITVMQLVLRFMRLATAELVGDIVPPLRNVHLSTLLASILGIILVATGWWQYLWVLFGGANQLMASLALLIVSIWLVTQHKNPTFALVPMIFMFVTTIGALCYTSYELWQKVAAGAGTAGSLFGNGLMGAVAVFLVIAALILAFDGVKALIAGMKPTPSPEPSSSAS